MYIRQIVPRVKDQSQMPNQITIKIACHYYLRLYVMILLEDELHFDLFSFVAVVILLVFSFSSAGIKIEEAISFTTCSKTAARISSLAAWS